VTEGAFDGPDAVAAAFEAQDYLADPGLATIVHLAMRMQRPLFLEGAPGVGKTEVAKVLAAITGGRLIRLSCYEGIDASQALYEWDYSRQLLHLRAAEVTGAATGTATGGTLEDELYTDRFLVRRPLLDAITSGEVPPPVLLVDEVDRADDEFEAFLLEVLADWSVTVPELGTYSATVPPLTVLTSNRSRDVHDALKRRCLYHWIEHPSVEREVAIVARKVPEVSSTVSEQVAELVQRFRQEQLYKPPGIAETIDWARALAVLGVDRLDVDVVSATLGAVIKYREDQARVRDGLPGFVAEAVERTG
jgi:MoxR-like ATPase